MNRRAEWKERLLGEVCLINPHRSEVDSVSDETDVTFLPMASVSNCGIIVSPEKRKLSEVRGGFTYFKENDVLFAKITPCMENGKGAIATGLINRIGFGSTEFHVLRPKGEVSADWVYYFLSRREFRKEAASQMTGTAGQKRVPRQFLEEVKIPVPPLSIQGKISAILRQATMIKLERYRVNQMTSKIVQAFFVNMFGDPSGNPKEWQIKTIKEVVRDVQPGFAFGKYNLKDGIPHLRPFNVSKAGSLNMDELKYVPEAKVPENYLLTSGDVIFNNTNSEELVGKSALFKKTIRCTYSNHMTRLRFDNQLATPEYMWALLNMLFSRGVFSRICKRWVNQAAVDGGQLMLLEVPIPPLQEQNRFSHVVERVDEIKRKQNDSTREIEVLLSTLVDGAFRGELVV